jgi:NADPH2:quinone reductase
MNAIVVGEYGGPEVLRLAEVEEPRTGAGEVKIAVEYAGVNFVETILRKGPPSGGPRPAGAPSLPYIPGNEVGGRVIETGEGVDATWLDRLVVARLNGTGGYAEHVTINLANVYPVPEGARLADAVALVAQGRTAIGVRNDLEIAPGEHVLITAAGGGVGSLLIQLARAAGAGLIVGAARGDAKLELARALGADLALDYSRPGWIEEARVATGGRGFDAAIDGIGGEIGHAAFDLLANGTGRLVIFGFSSGQPVSLLGSEIFGRSLRVIGYGAGRGSFAETIPRYIAEALAELAAGRLKPTIGQIFPLAAAASAHRAVEHRETIGKILLQVK